MRYTLLLVGVAAAAALIADGAHAHGRGHTTTQVERRVITVDGSSVEDAQVYRSGDDRMPSEGDYRRRWHHDADANADDDRDDDRDDRASDAAGSTAYSAYRPGRPGYWEEHCRRDNGVGGAAIGGVVGGVAGNRIAGRGNRVAGTLIGAGVGAVAGAVIDRAEDRDDCGEGYRADRSGYHRHGRQVRTYDHGYGNGGGRYTSYGNGDRYASYGNGDRYAYDGYRGAEIIGYAPGPVTTIIEPGRPIIVEETTTTYETVRYARARVAPRRPIHRRPHPRPRPTCGCGS